MITGFEGFRKALPDYDNRKAKLTILRLPGFTVVFVIIQALLTNIPSILVQTLESGILEAIEPIIPIILDILFILIGTLIAQIGFRAKHKLLSEDPKRAYQKVVKKVLLGISMVFSAMIASYIPIISPVSEVSIVLSRPFLRTSLGLSFVIIRIITGILCLGIGARTAYQAVANFGIDTASLVYVYYPEEAEVVDHEIYSVVRHPMYLAVYLIAFGSFFVYFSGFAFITLFIVIFSFYRHIFIVEERELIERFGDSYKEYSEKVPALLIHPKNWGKFFKFLI